MSGWTFSRPEVRMKKVKKCVGTPFDGEGI